MQYTFEKTVSDLAVSPSVLEVGAGAGVSFFCFFSSSYAPYSIQNLTWFRHGMGNHQQIPPWPQRVGVIQQLDMNSLELRFLVTEPIDTDIYSCDLRDVSEPESVRLQVSGNT